MDPRDERLFKLEIRLAATEYLLANVYASSFARLPDPTSEVKTANNLLRTVLRAQTVPGVEPVWSDHVTAEMQDAIERVLTMMEDMVATSTAAPGPAPDNGRARQSAVAAP